MAHDVRIAISCPDRTGLLSALTGRLFDLGADMGDASFAVLGEAAEFATVARLTVSLPMMSEMHSRHCPSSKAPRSPSRRSRSGSPMAKVPM